MATVRTEYGTSTNNITNGGSVHSLANGSSANSSAVANTGGLDIDVLVELAFQGSTASNTGEVLVYLQTSIDGTNWTDDENDVPLTAVQMDGTNIARHRIPLAYRNGGTMPRNWRLRVENQSGDALAASGNFIGWRGVWLDVS